MTPFKKRGPGQSRPDDVYEGEYTKHTFQVDVVLIEKFDHLVKRRRTNRRELISEAIADLLRKYHAF
jgi:hypothetical protein